MRHAMGVDVNGSEKELNPSQSSNHRRFLRIDGQDHSRDSVESLDPDDDTVPYIHSRNGKWWYSTFHNVTAMVGAGVLGLPTTMAYLGWGPGALVLVLSWLITLYTLWQMVQMHEMLPGKRFDRYHELGQEAFGPKLGLWIVVPQQLIVNIGGTIVYMVTGGYSLWQFYKMLACPRLPVVDEGNQCCKGIGKASFIVIFAAPQFFLAQLGNFNSIASISLAASVMSLCYCTIAWGDSIYLGNVNHSSHDSSSRSSPSPSPSSPRFDDYGYPNISTADMVFGVFNSLGTIAFAYAGHNVVLEIQAMLPSTTKKPSKIAMWRGVVVAYVVVAICYFPVAFVGYWAFGNSLVNQARRGNPGSGNILLQLRKPRGLIAAANMMVVVHVTGSYQVYAMPVFDMLEIVLVNRFRLYITPRSTSMLRIVTRSTYVFATAFIACTLPFFHDLLGFLGGFSSAPSTYFLPCIIWLILKKPKVFSFSWILNWFLIVIGVLIAFVATIGGMRNIIMDASSNKFYQFTCHNTTNV